MSGTRRTLTGKCPTEADTSMGLGPTRERLVDPMTESTVTHDPLPPSADASVLDRHGKVWVRMSPDRDPNIWRTEPPSLVAGWRTWQQLQELDGPLVVVAP